ncbi:hypothetical protein EJ06DRAFT_483115 [Trichodelitschia bisporula]|uniref:Zn(2)-C6 fungal-type domain-containing protein n=1 Tax=Trichodelitschia bisporula TaxID=703511 RepID=A0A6G1HL43_9PEZI|nr:hypothetical protein EJ06DRAFT_483115 [Trichodelitschia bisporula]
MPLETPLLRVSRPVAACQRCRQAKIKCDGKLPACSACERTNRTSECSSTNDQFAKGKERSYVATLESRVERLERKISEARARRKSSIALADSTAARRVSVDANNKPKDPRLARRKELSDIDELVADFGFLAVNATARDFYGFTNGMTYARLIISASSRELLPSGMMKEYPPSHTARSLVLHYLDVVFTMLPLFEEASIWASVDAVYSDNPWKASMSDHWVVRMILAIGSLLQSQQRGDTHYSDAIGHVCAALDVAEQVLHPGSIASIQAMVLLVQYASLDPAHFDNWTLIGAASRMMVDLGMHQDPSKSAMMLRTKLELRRRVYWCVYALDRSASIVENRAFSFSDDASSVAMPFRAKLLSPPASPSIWQQSHEPALALFHLRQLQSEWYTKIFQSGRTPWLDPYQEIWPIYAEMSKWFSGLPPTLPPHSRMFFEREILYSYVHLLSSSPRCPHPSPQAQRLLFEHAVAFAARIHDATKHKEPAITYHDTRRAYHVAHRFVETLDANFEPLLRAAIYPAASLSIFPTSPLNLDAEVDPLAGAGSAQAQIQPPAVPEIYPPETANETPAFRAKAAIDSFIAALSALGARFGHVDGVSWRDQFQTEALSVLVKLDTRLKQEQQLAQGLSPSMGSQGMGPEFDVWNNSGSAGVRPVSSPMGLSPSPHHSSQSVYPSPASTAYSPQFVHNHTHHAPQQQWNDGSDPNLPLPGYYGNSSNDLVVMENTAASMPSWESIGGSTDSTFM